MDSSTLITGNTAWRDIRVYADHACIVSDNSGSHGMLVFDLTQLRFVVAPPLSFSKTSHYAGFSEGHNIAISAADSRSAIRIVSGVVRATGLKRSHGDLYPQSAPDGVINLSDLVLLLQRVLNE